VFLHLTFDQSLTLLSVIAIFSSPLVALEIQKRLDKKRSRTDRKMDIFRKLMTTRASTMNPAHVEGLNSIEIEFHAKDGPDKKVLDAWKLYASHLNAARMQPGPDLNRWVERKQELLTELLHEMALALGYDISKATIKDDTYYPQGYVDVEQEQHALRKAALEVFSGARPLAATVVGEVQTSAPLPLLNEIQAQPVQTQRPALPANAGNDGH
jgi:hypothetical protein